MSFSVRVMPGPGFARVIAGLAAAAAGQPLRLATMGAQASEAAVAALQSVAPYDGDDPGPHLRDQFVAEVGGGNPTVVTVANTSEHRDFVVYGHGDIYPVNAHALHFVTHGTEVFTMHVGPVGPNDYPSRAVDALQTALATIAAEDAATIAAEIAGV